jgi:ubiquinone/menaquinone biosynthesis C-methylase UbiE
MLVRCYFSIYVKKTSPQGACACLFFSIKYIYYIQMGLSIMEHLQEMNHTYWSHRAPGYSAYNQEELSDDRKDLWSETLLRLIEVYHPYRAPEEIRVLDIGTGPGFFALLLSEAGYAVTALDCTEEMLEEARKNIAQCANPITFVLGDAQQLPFADNSFDVIVTRNVTWNLPHPKSAYKEWYRVLNSNGVLFNFDADWYGHLFDEEKMAAYEEDRARVALNDLEDYNIGENFDQMDAIAREMPLSKADRPQWDLDTMNEVGFASVSCEPEIWRSVWTDIEIINNGSRTIFLVIGRKDERKERITSYWDHRSESFLAQRRAELHDPISERWLREIHRFLPKNGALRILDVGCGTGYFSILLAREGHDVTGIDLTPSMIENARILAAEERVSCTFLTMDAENPDFESEHFDLVVTRNLTWTLPHVEQSYREWLRVLKKDGILLNFDANYGIEDSADTSHLPACHAHHTLGHNVLVENNAIKQQLPVSYHSRPAWDIEVLGRLGCEVFELDLGVSKRIYLEKDAFYNPTPLFLLAARK